MDTNKIYNLLKIEEGYTYESVYQILESQGAEIDMIDEGESYEVEYIYYTADINYCDEDYTIRVKESREPIYAEDEDGNEYIEYYDGFADVEIKIDNEWHDLLCNFGESEE